MNTTAQPRMDIDKDQAGSKTPPATPAKEQDPKSTKTQTPATDQKKPRANRKKKAETALAADQIPADAVSSARFFVSSEAAQLAGMKRAANGAEVKTAEVKPGYWRWWLDTGKSKG